MDNIVVWCKLIEFVQLFQAFHINYTNVGLSAFSLDTTLGQGRIFDYHSDIFSPYKVHTYFKYVVF